MTDPRPACAGDHELFDSTDPRDHAVAREICTGCCPVRDWCAGELRTVQAAAVRAGNYRDVGPQGTWAGMLIGKPTRRREVA